MKKTLLCLTAGFLLISCQFTSDPEEAKTTLPDTKTVLMSSSGAATALTFINDYVKNRNTMDETETLQWVNTHLEVTQEFKDSLTHLITKARLQDPELGLDADPIFDAQDNPEEGFELLSTDSKSGYITVRGKQWKEFKLNLKMKNEEGRWLVDGCGIVNIPLEKRIQR